MDFFRNFNSLCVDEYEGSVVEEWPEERKSDVGSEVGKNIFSIRCLQFFKWAWKIKKYHINIEFKVPKKV